MDQTKRKKKRIPRELDRSGALCLAFANTAAVRHDNRIAASLRPATPPLASYEDLVTWGGRLDVLEAEESDRLRHLAAEQAEQASEVFSRALPRKHHRRRKWTNLRRTLWLLTRNFSRTR